MYRRSYLLWSPVIVEAAIPQAWWHSNPFPNQCEIKLGREEKREVLGLRRGGCANLEGGGGADPTQSRATVRCGKREERKMPSEGNVTPLLILKFTTINSTGIRNNSSATRTNAKPPPNTKAEKHLVHTPTTFQPKKNNFAPEASARKQLHSPSTTLVHGTYATEYDRASDGGYGGYNSGWRAIQRFTEAARLKSPMLPEQFFEWATSKLSFNRSHSSSHPTPLSKSKYQESYSCYHVAPVAPRFIRFFNNMYLVW